jgi:hypothetical protein
MVVSLQSARPPAPSGPSGRRRFLAIEALDRQSGRAAREAAGPQLIPKPDELSWWEWAVLLLHTAAEIEHALLVQYLYGAYSLESSGFLGPQVPADAATMTASWRNTIVEVAREEMAHLLTEQNLLRFIDGPLNIERQDLPFRSDLYPFAFALEPLSRDSLAKYVAAEMPAEPGIPAAELAEIITRATGSSGGMPINRVGVVFDTLVDLFSDPAKLPDSDLRPATVTDVQSSKDDWFGFGEMIVLTVATRAQAVDALEAIGEQGEGSQPGSTPETAHFDRFLAIYRAFPETEDTAQQTWFPARPVPVNPNTLPGPAPDSATEAGRITEPVSLLWARLHNVRYHMLLAELTHALLLSGPYDGPAPTPRGHLRDRAINDMGFLRGIGGLLTTRPLKPPAGSSAPATAGPPFELPSTLILADVERGRWRLHKALLDSSAALIAALTAAGGSGAILSGLTAADSTARIFVEAQLAAS